MKIYIKNPMRKFKRITLALVSTLIIFFAAHPAYRGFIISYFYNFKSIGAVKPSSQGLALEMVKHLPENAGYVVELGAGTGVFTKEITKKVKKEDFFIIENDDSFFSLLKKDFNDFNVYPYSAEKLHQFLPSKVQGKISYIISGLPLRSLPSQVKENIFSSIKKVLSPEGTIIQFTYFNSPPITAQECKKYNLEEGVLSGRVLLNLPPAYVWIYKNKKTTF